MQTVELNKFACTGCLWSDSSDSHSLLISPCPQISHMLIELVQLEERVETANNEKQAALEQMHLVQEQVNYHFDLWMPLVNVHACGIMSDGSFSLSFASDYRVQARDCLASAPTRRGAWRFEPLRRRAA
jgi:hypothetical protein